MNRLAYGFVAVAIVLSTASSSATAQPGARRVARNGVTFGFSVGGGSFSLADCDLCEEQNGVSFGLQAGLMMSPRLALMLDGFAVADRNDFATITHVITTAAAQYWVAPRVWIKGGLGVGRLSIRNNDGSFVLQSETGTGVLVAGGVELMQTRSFALDLQLRGSAVTYDSNDTIAMGAVNLGFNWY